MGQLDGKVAVITASTRSIGRGIAEAYHAEGAKVVLSGRNAEKGAKAIEEMGGGDRLHFIAANAAKQADIEALVDGTVEKFGRVDIIVPNAGDVNATAPVAMISDEEWQYELDFNINQTFWMTRRALKYMIPQQFGRIIGMSSMYGKISTMAVPGYITNKHAIIGLMKAVAKEVGVDMARLTRDMDGPEVKAALAETMQIGESLGINGTPSYVVGQDVVVGAVGFESLQTRIANLRKCGKSMCG